MSSLVTSLALAALLTAPLPQDPGPAALGRTPGSPRPQRIPPGSALASAVNLGLRDPFAPSIEGPRAVFLRSEGSQDLNGDGDTVDRVVQAFDLALGVVSNLGIAADGVQPLRVEGGIVFVGTRESQLGLDLNGDQDALDLVLAMHCLSSGERAYPAALPMHDPFGAHTPDSVALVGQALVVEASEVGEGQDLSGDGDQTDVVLKTILYGRRGGLAPVGQATLPALVGREPIGPRPSTGCCEGSFFGAVTSLFRQDGKHLFVAVDETTLGPGTDLNGDGDVLDTQVLHVFDLDGGRGRNLGLAVSAIELVEGRAAVLVEESQQGSSDLNGDGDATDRVLFLVDPLTASVSATQTALATGSSLRVVAGRVVVVRSEFQDALDLNGDGDQSDLVPVVFDPATGAVVNPGLAAQIVTGAGHRIHLLVREDWQAGTDLNGDGDTLDTVLHDYDVQTGVIRNLATAVVSNLSWGPGGRLVAIFVSEASQAADFNFDGDAADVVLGWYDGATDTFKNTALALGSGLLVTAGGGTAAFVVGEGPQGSGDLNGDGDLLDDVLFVYDADSQASATTALAAATFPFFLAVSEELVLFTVDEDDQGQDLDGDGLLTSRVLHYVDAR